MKTIYLQNKDIPENLRRHYRGNKFAVIVCEFVTLRNTYWSGGSKASYSAIDLKTGEHKPLALNSAPVQFGTDLDQTKISLKPDYAIVEHKIFSGKDMGLIFYIHADNASLFITQQAAVLSPAERCLLRATYALKASYNGRKPRLEMMVNNGFKLYEIENAMESLKANKMLNKAGAITALGKNNMPERGEFKEY